MSTDIVYLAPADLFAEDGTAPKWEVRGTESHEGFLVAVWISESSKASTFDRFRVQLDSTGCAGGPHGHELGWLELEMRAELNRGLLYTVSALGEFPAEPAPLAKAG